MRAYIVLLVVIAVAIMGTDAEASNWSMNGSSCVPGDPAIQNNSYTITGGSTTHQGGATGRITLHCPITRTWGSNRRRSYG